MKKRILLVEDEVWLAELYAQLLGRDYIVQWVRDGYAAIDAIEARRPHVIVLDLLLPWANGMQLLHELQSHSDLQDVPIIICSNALPPNKLDLMAYGVRAVLDKATMGPKQLVAAVAGLA